MFKKITLMLILALLVTTAGARDYGMTYHEIQIVDELGRPVTNITNLYIYNAGGATDATIYMDRGRQKAITIPMIEGGPNSTLVDGYCYWWGPDGYNFSVSNDDAVGPMTNAGHIPRTGSETALIFPSYLRAISAANILDGQTLDIGTGPEWEIAGGAPMDETLRFVPTGDDYTFIVGSTTVGFTSSFHVPINATEGLIIDAATGTFTWDGGAVLLNDDSANDVGICTGTSTGNVDIATGGASGDITIGNSAAGPIIIDTDTTITITADDAITVTNDAADQTYTTASSLNFISTENAALAIYNHANGAAATTIHTYNQTGTSASAAGQYVAAIQLKALVGGIGLYSALNNDNAIRIESNGGVLGTINIHNNLGEDHAAGIASIQLLSDDGAIGLMATNETAAGAGESAIQLTAGAGAIELLSSLDATNAIKLTANGGANSDIVIWNDTGTSQDAVFILIDDGGMTITATEAIDDGAILYVTGTVEADSQLWGGIYADIAIADTTDGMVAAVAGVIWPESAAAPVGIVTGGYFGIQETDADLSGASIYGIVVQTLLAAGGNDPAIHAMMRFNTSEGAELPDYWFQAANQSAVAYVGNAVATNADTNKVGAIKIAIVGIGDCYLYIYDHPGS